MDILRQMIEDQWQRTPPDKMRVNLAGLASEIDQATELDHWLLVQLHLARAHTMSLDFAIAENILQEVVQFLGSAMVRHRTLYFLEKGRVLIARGEAEQGLKRWEVAERVALEGGLVDLADETSRLRRLHRELMINTDRYTYDEMETYVQASLAEQASSRGW